MKVLKFGAVWCKECIVMRSIWQEIENEIPDLKTQYYDADMDDEKVKEYSIEKIPAFVFLDSSDKELFRLNGALNKETLVKKVEENLDK